MIPIIINKRLQKTKRLNLQFMCVFKIDNDNNRIKVECKKKVEKKFSAAWSSLPVLRFWLAADYDCILGCRKQKSEKKLSV
jgi:hypothetical protein